MRTRAGVQANIPSKILKDEKMAELILTLIKSTTVGRQWNWRSTHRELWRAWRARH